MVVVAAGLVAALVAAVAASLLTGGGSANRTVVERAVRSQSHGVHGVGLKQVSPPGAPSGNSAARSSNSAAPSSNSAALSSNSAINQYTEEIPAAEGGVGSFGILRQRSGRHASLSASMRHALEASGHDGGETAALADATAPIELPRGGPNAVRLSSQHGVSPGTQVFKALVGSGGGGGVGPAFPAILIGTVVCATAVAVAKWRLRRRSGDDAMR